MHDDHKSLAELHCLGVGIPVRSHPDKSSVVCRHAIVSAIPTASVISGLKDQCAVTIENPQQKFGHVARMKRAERIVQSVIIGSKCIWQCQFTCAGFPHDMYGSCIDRKSVV